MELTSTSTDGLSSTLERPSLKVFKATDHVDEMWNLLQKHRDELATNKELMILQPDIERYKVLEDQGILLSISVNLGQKIIGYSINVIAPNMHYSGLTVCQNDLIYVEPEHRGGVGGTLMSFTKELAKERGAMMMVWHAKPGTVLAHELARTCRIQDIIFSENL